MSYRNHTLKSLELQKQVEIESYSVMIEPNLLQRLQILHSAQKQLMLKQNKSVRKSVLKQLNWWLNRLILIIWECKLCLQFQQHIKDQRFKTISLKESWISSWPMMLMPEEPTQVILEKDVVDFSITDFVKHKIEESY